MKTPTQVLADIQRRLTNNWHRDITETTTTWPHALPLGAVTKTDLEGNFHDFQQRIFDWQDWASTHGLALTYATRRVHGTNQPIPTHLTVPDLNTAATLIGPDWTHRLARARKRADTLATRFPCLSNRARTVHAVDPYTDLDFELLCLAADWFAANADTARGLTPRQVPIEGLHAKWLNTHQSLIEELAGIKDLGLLPKHPPRINFTYLDPDYLATGDRRHDSATVGDTFTPAYQPDVIVISENKDTAIHFPPLTRGISIEGAGTGGSTAAAFPWITGCPRLYYWGDMDTAGLQILNGYRQAGVPVTSILMNLDAYTAHEKCGSTADTCGKPLTCAPRRSLPHLTSDEHTLYEALTDPTWTRVRRIEQERIPLHLALNEVAKRCTDHAGKPAGWNADKRSHR